MKVFNTGRTIRLNNIESFEKVEIGATFFNFTKDISRPQYELIDKKFYLLVLDDDEPNHDKDNPDYVIRKIEIKSEDWFKSRYDAYNKYNIEAKYCGDRFDGEFVIESTIKNLSTGETFINCEYERNLNAFVSDDLAEWSAFDENEAFELADWYYKMNR
jgi:hypothetical protein